MSRSLFVPLTLLFLIFGSTVAANASSWRSLALAASKAADTNRIDMAKRLWSEALAEARKTGSDNPCFSISLRNLAYLYFISDPATGKAERLFRSELALLEPLGANYSDLAFDLLYLGRIDAIQGKMQPALAEYDRALQCCNRVSVARDVVPDTLAYMVVPCYALGKVAKETESENQLADGLFRQEKTWNAAIVKMNAYASSLDADGKRAGGSTAPLFYRAAINLLTSSQKFSEQKCPKDKQLLASIHKQKALSYSNNFHDYQAAFDETAATLPILEPVAQQDPDSFGQMLYEAGNYLYLLNRNEKAVSFFKRSIEFLEKKNKLSAAERWNRWKQLADLEATNGNFTESLRILQKLKLETTTDAQRYLLFIGLSSWYHTNGNETQALNNVRQAHLSCGKMALKIHIDLLVNLSDYCSAISLTEAESCMKEAISLAEGAYKNDSSGLASVLIHAGSRASLSLPLRIAYIERALALLQTKPHCVPSELANGLIARASCFITQGKPAECIRYASQAVDLWSQTPGQEANQANALILIAHADVNQGDYSKADYDCQQYCNLLEKSGQGSGVSVRAQFLALDGHYDKLESFCRSSFASAKATDREKETLEFWRLFGMLKTGRAAEAVRLSNDVWLKKLALDPNWKGCVLLLRGRALSLVGQHEMAQTVLEDGVRAIRPYRVDWAVVEIANARFYQADDFLNNNQPAQAEKAYVEALKLYQQTHTTWLDMRQECQLNLEQLRSSQRGASTKPKSVDHSIETSR